MATRQVRGDRRSVQFGAAVTMTRYKCPACDVLYTLERTCVGLPWSVHEPVQVVPVEDVPQPDTIVVTGG